MFTIFSSPEPKAQISYYDQSPSVVRPSTPLNGFFSNPPPPPPGPIFIKFHMEPSVNGGLKIYTNGHGPLIKLAVMTIYGKNT